jgi:alpha-galactosidase
LHTVRSSYVLVLGPSDVPVTAHWGRRISDPTAAALAEIGHAWHPWESPLDGLEEYPSDTGLRFVEPALAIRDESGRTVAWRMGGDEVVETGDATELRLHLTELTRPLGLTLHYRLQAGHDVIERWATIHNGLGTPIELMTAASGAWCPPGRDAYRLSTLHGRWAAETTLQRAELPVGTTALGSRQGATSPLANPWFALDDATATEDAGEVWSVALAWSGTWRTSVQRLPNGRVTAVVAATHESPTAILGPGETYVTPISVGLWTDEGFGAASRGWHGYARDQVLPVGEELLPVIYNSWEATAFDVNEANQMALAERAAALGCELFVMDDGWFGARVNDFAGLGDWTPNPRRFPDGLGPLIDRVGKLGMRFGLWVEPEMVNPDSDLYRAHPDWVYHSPGYPRHELRHQLVLDLGRDDVAAWMHEWLDRLLRENDIAYLKWDLNRPVTDPGAAIGWSDKHVRNLYGILDRLRIDHPAVRFESCASGGGRADLGILARADQVWTSDNTDAADRLFIQEGFTQILPVRAMRAWVTDSPNPLTGRVIPLRFRFHVAMSGVLSIGGGLPQWSDADLAEATALIAQYKRIRPIVQLGDLYRLRSPRDTAAAALAYRRGDEVVVFGFLSGNRYAQHAAPVRLGFLNGTGTWVDADRGTAYTEEYVREHGLDLGLGREFDSTAVHLRRSTVRSA